MRTSAAKIAAMASTTWAAEMGTEAIVRLRRKAT
jgi:hypothetical protein